jgi:hypothetical protein
MSDAVETAINPNEDVSREKFYGYKNTKEYQRDLRLYYDEKICGALNQQGKFCRNNPLENGRCKYHGGKTPVGIEAKNTKHGRYSKYIPVALMEKYRHAEEDTDLMSLKGEMALVTARLYELVEKIEDTAGKIPYSELLRQYERFKMAERAGQDNAEYLKLEFEAMLVSIKEDMKIWDEVAHMVNVKRRLVDSEQKKMKQMSQYVEVDRVMLLFGALMDIVVNEIEELEGIKMDVDMIEQVTTKIAKKFRSVANRHSGQYNPNPE